MEFWFLSLLITSEADNVIFFFYRPELCFYIFIFYSHTQISPSFQWSSNSLIRKTTISKSIRPGPFAGQKVLAGERGICSHAGYLAGHFSLDPVYTRSLGLLIYRKASCSHSYRRRIAWISASLPECLLTSSLELHDRILRNASSNVPGVLIFICSCFAW